MFVGNAILALPVIFPIIAGIVLGIIKVKNEKTGRFFVGSVTVII